MRTLFFVYIFGVVSALSADSSDPAVLQKTLASEEGMNSFISTVTPENREEKLKEAVKILQLQSSHAETQNESAVNAVRVLGRIAVSPNQIQILYDTAKTPSIKTQLRVASVRTIAEFVRKTDGDPAVCSAMEPFLDSENPLVSREAKFLVASTDSKEAQALLFKLLDVDISRLPPPDFKLTKENGPGIEAKFANVISDIDAISKLNNGHMKGKTNEAIGRLRKMYPSGPGLEAVLYLEKENSSPAIPSANSSR